MKTERFSGHYYVHGVAGDVSYVYLDIKLKCHFSRSAKGLSFGSEPPDTKYYFLWQRAVLTHSTWTWLIFLKKLSFNAHYICPFQITIWYVDEQSLLSFMKRIPGKSQGVISTNDIIFWLYSHKCFTGENTTGKIHTKLHAGLKWRIFSIVSLVIVDSISRFFHFCLRKQSVCLSNEQKQTYTVVWGCELYFLVLKTIFYSLAAFARKILF